MTDPVMEQTLAVTREFLEGFSGPDSRFARLVRRSLLLTHGFPAYVRYRSAHPFHRKRLRRMAGK